MIEWVEIDGHAEFSPQYVLIIDTEIFGKKPECFPWESNP